MVNDVRLNFRVRDIQKFSASKEILFSVVTDRTISFLKRWNAFH